MTHGSLFSGVGGFDLGFAWAGIETLWDVEIDPYCQKVLRKNFPNTEIYSDVREVGKHNLAPVDILSGGFPCQDISVAGKQAGIADGTRSGLWSEFHRIIGELRPRYVVIENVANLLVLGLERVLCDLAEIGYDAEWQIISANDVGATHLRKRIWIVAYPNTDSLGPHRPGVDATQRGVNAQCGAEGLCEDMANTNRNGAKRDKPQDRQGRGLNDGGENVSNAKSRGRNEHETDGEHGKTETQGLPGDRGGLFGGREWWSVEPDVGRVANGVPSRVDRLKGLGNAVVPQIPYIIGKAILEAA